MAPKTSGSLEMGSETQPNLSKARKGSRLSSTGARRVAAYRPGNTQQPKTFIHPYEEEAVCAAYNGYSDVGKFRQFLTSGVFLRSFNLFREISQNLAPRFALGLLRDDEENIMTTPLEEAGDKWPVDKSNKGAKMNRSYRLANVLAHCLDELQRRPNQLHDKAKAQERHFQDVEKLSLVQILEPGENIPPVLGPFEDLGEAKLEAYNRLYFRFGNPNFNAPCKIQIDCVPGWMRTPKPQVDVVSQEEIDADELWESDNTFAKAAAVKSSLAPDPSAKVQAEPDASSKPTSSSNTDPEESTLMPQCSDLDAFPDAGIHMEQQMATVADDISKFVEDSGALSSLQPKEHLVGAVRESEQNQSREIQVMGGGKKGKKGKKRTFEETESGDIRESGEV